MLKRLWISIVLAFMACQGSGTPVTLTASVATAWVCQACVPVPGPTGGSVSTGGLPATGGKTSTGGTTAAGGRTVRPTTGGAVSTGGSSSTCVAIASDDLPKPANLTADDTKRAHQHRLHPRKHRPHGRAMQTPETAGEECSTWFNANCRTLDQGAVGACTGYAWVMTLSTWPSLLSTHCNPTDARLAYQGGTCKDQGCVIPCTCASCPKAFCPDTGANDVGSYTSSVADWLVQKGWLKGYTTADTLSQLKACLTKGPATIGVDWYNSMFTPDAKTGELKVLTSSGLAGGHDLNAVAKVITDAGVVQVWIHNSWGDTWGFCNQSNCGYAWINAANLAKLNYDADCPVL